MKLTKIVLKIYFTCIAFVCFNSAIVYSQIEIIRNSDLSQTIKFKNGIIKKIDGGRISGAGLTRDSMHAIVKINASMVDTLAWCEIYDSNGNEVRKFNIPLLPTVCLSNDLKYAVYGSSDPGIIGREAYLYLYNAEGDLKYKTTKPLAPTIRCMFINNGDYFFVFADSLWDKSGIGKSLIIIFNHDLSIIGQAVIESNTLIEKVYFDYIDEDAKIIHLKIFKYGFPDGRHLKYNYNAVLIN